MPQGIAGGIMGGYVVASWPGSGRRRPQLLLPLPLACELGGGQEVSFSSNLCV